MALSQSIFIDNSPGSIHCWDRIHNQPHAQKSPRQKLEPLQNIPPSLTVDLVGISNSETARRAENLEKALQFLQAHHTEILACLQEEVDALKRQNRELQLKVAVLQNPDKNPLQALEILKTKTANKRCQTDGDNSCVSDNTLKKKIDCLNSQVNELNKALDDEKMKVTSAKTDLEKIEKNKSDAVDSLLGEKKHMNSVREEHMGRNPLDFRYSLPAISHNQFVCNRSNYKDKVLGYSNRTIELSCNQAAVKDFSTAVNSQGLSLNNNVEKQQSSRELHQKQMGSQNSISRQPHVKKSSAMEQMPKINLNFTENSESTKPLRSNSPVKTRRKSMHRKAAKNPSGGADN